MNSSVTTTNISNQTGEFTAPYIAIGVIHLVLVIMVCLILGPIVLYYLVSALKRNRDPITLILTYIAFLCTISPTTLGLLMDISLITNIPVIGQCSSSTANIFWALAGSGAFLLLFDTALLSVVQYLVIRFGPRVKKRIAALTILFLAVFQTLSLIVGITLLIRPSSSVNTQIRGSLCEDIFVSSQHPIHNFLGVAYFVVFLVPSVLIVVVFSIVTYKFVKKNTIDNSDVIKAVLKVQIILTSCVILLRLPPLSGLVLGGSGDIARLFSFISAYAIELTYPTYLFLIVTIHTSVRKSLFEMFRHFCSKFKRHNSVNPASN